MSGSEPNDSRPLWGTLLQNSADLWSRSLRLLHTSMVSHRFRRWGKQSMVSPPLAVSSQWAIEVGDHEVTREHAWLNVRTDRGAGRASLTIGDGTYIGRFVHIDARRDVVPNVLVSDRVYISDADYSHGAHGVPIIQQEVMFSGRVVLCAACWLGIGTVILTGVRIGRNAVVAANAVVTSDVPDYARWRRTCENPEAQGPQDMTTERPSAQ